MARRQIKRRASLAAQATAAVAVLIGALSLASLAKPSALIEQPPPVPGAAAGPATGIEPTDGQLRSSLAAAAADASARAPIPITAGTTLVGAVVSGRKLVYHLSVSRNLPDHLVDGLRESAAPAIRKSTCENAEKRELIRLGATLSYRFRFPSGREFALNIEDCT